MSNNTAVQNRCSVMFSWALWGCILASQGHFKIMLANVGDLGVCVCERHSGLVFGEFVMVC
jgi:hypothetical protein